jgi:hypothetical protein
MCRPALERNQKRRRELGMAEINRKEEEACARGVFCK